MAGQSVIISVLADTKPFNRGVQSAGDSASKLSSLVAPLAGAVAAAFSVAAIVNFTKKAIASASELEQSVGGVEAVFKDGAAQIQTWASTAATAAGLTAEQYNKTATLIGTYLKSAGVPMDQLGTKTNDLVTRGADLAAMFGGTAEEAVNAIGSALRGEFEPLRRYGVALSQAEIQARALADTGKSSADALTTQEKALAVQALIFEKSADAAGTFARESDTLAGQQQRLAALSSNLGATFGQILLPAATAVTAAIAGLLQKLTNSEGFQRFLDGALAFTESLFSGESAIGGFVAQIAPLLGYLSPLGLAFKVLEPLLPTIADALGQVASTIGGALMAVLPTVASALKQVTGILSGALAAILPVLIPVVLQLAQVIGNVLAAVLPIVGTLLEAFAEILTALIPVVMPIIEAVLGIVQAFLPLIDLIASLIGPLLTPLIDLLVALLVPILDLIAPLLELLAPALQFVAEVLAAVIGWVVQAVAFFLQLITGSEEAKAGVEAVWNGVLDFFAGIPKAIGDFFAGAVNWLVDAGKNIIDGLLNGLKDAIEGVWSWIEDIGQGIGDTFAGILGIHSPSRVFAGYGKNIVQGLVDGLSDTARLSSAMDALSADVAGGFSAQLEAPDGYRAGAGGNRYEIHVEAIAPGPEVGRAIVAAIEDYERFGGAR